MPQEEKFPQRPRRRQRGSPPPEEGPYIFRTTLDEDGEVRILQLPATLENLLDPRLEDQLTQADRHAITLVPIYDALKRYLRRLAPKLSVFFDLLLLYKRHGERDLSPDVTVVEGIPPRDDRESLDVIAEGGRLRLVVEVVSTKHADGRRKDEEANPDLFARLGAEDLVLVYPPESGKPLRVDAKQLVAPGTYAPNRPDSRGRILLRSVDLYLRVDPANNRLELIHRQTGERLLTSEEEEEARREAERRAAKEAQGRREAERRAVEEAQGRREAEQGRREAERRVAEAEQGRREAERRAAEADARGRTEALLELLEDRGIPMDDDDRQRVLACRDTAQLRGWSRRALTAESLSDVWDGATWPADSVSE